MPEFIPPNSYSVTHLLYIGFAIILWFTVPISGKIFMNDSQRRVMAIILIIFTLGQEIVNDSLLIISGLWDYSSDMALHMCGFSLFLSSWALYSKRQSAFELSYFWGISGASQAIFTPDLSGVWNSFGIFIFFFSHTMIILNVIWLMVVGGMRLRKSAFLNTILITNGFCFIMTILNQLVNGNYWYLSARPLSDSPFLVGGWPFYIIGVQFFGILIMGLTYIPWLPYFRRLTLQSDPSVD